MLQDLLPCPMGRFSPEVTQWMENPLTPMDYFLGDDFRIIRFHGFIEEPFRLPIFITYRVYTLEACRQETLADNIYGVRRNKTKIYFLPRTMSNSHVMLNKWKAEGELTNLLVALGLVLICDKWDYNPIKHFSLKHES